MNRLGGRRALSDSHPAPERNPRMPGIRPKTTEAQVPPNQVVNSLLGAAGCVIECRFEGRDSLVKL